MANEESEKSGSAVQGRIDVSRPHSARIWNYLLGGKDNYEVDRMAGDKVVEVYPGMRDVTRQSRLMLTRVVSHLAGEAGIRQFLDIGTGLPSANNTHEVAQSIAPDARIVYVDNDPLVLVHAQALLTSTPEGACDYIEADVRDPETILREAARTLDFSQPVALMLMGILGLVTDEQKPQALVDRLLAALPSGSYLALYDGSDADPAYVEAITRHNKNSGAVPYTPRSIEQIARYFDGLELLEPGVVSVERWRPEPNRWGEAVPVSCAGGVARKP
ncbi:SAM-dependent methyltransferase [Streptomyces indicus]|uniref:O-Methyltransferase involved in polyketide biosynthesis n=1 Tax=Streptomyces indicus TaxID=417292 RepID=A0A1G8USR6_9ACTN|nr:SAM-dependent methyltransferase [Streptomyces indicus]SDJ56000.1 O-Methyltransferase involved in polyketide biosynthesis [Streptomyces indicus]